jgi:ABC-type antimicrobial peptide transport system permease subunit
MFFLVFGEGARLVGAGFVAGVIAAAALRWVLSSFLFGVSAADRSSDLIAAIATFVVALAVVVIPARRATRIEPAHALRAE